MNFKVLSMMVFFYFFSHAYTAQWNLNDVSYLFKIPHQASENTSGLLSPFSVGSKGELLPLEAFRRLPTLNNAGNGMDRAYKEELKVISVRIDPCPNTFEAS